MEKNRVVRKMYRLQCCPLACYTSHEYGADEYPIFLATSLSFMAMRFSMAIPAFSLAAFLFSWTWIALSIWATASSWTWERR